MINKKLLDFWRFLVVALFIEIGLMVTTSRNDLVSTIIGANLLLFLSSYTTIRLLNSLEDTNNSDLSGFFKTVFFTLLISIFPFFILMGMGGLFGETVTNISFLSVVLVVSYFGLIGIFKKVAFIPIGEQGGFLFEGKKAQTLGCLYTVIALILLTIFLSLI